jgi:hypothetical protein
VKRPLGSLLPLALLALASIAAAATVLRGRFEQHAAFPAGSSRAHAQPEPSVEAEPARVELDEYPAGTVVAPADRILAAHWGSEWEQVQGIYAKEGFDTSREFVVFPWSEASPHLVAEYRRAAELHTEAWAQGLLRWPDAPDLADWVKERLRVDRELTQEELKVVDSIASEHNPLIAALAEDCAEKLRAELERRWSQGRYFKSPIASYGMPRRPGAFYSTSVASHGWTLTVDMFDEECGEVLELRNEIKHLRQQRDAAIRGYLAW